MKIRFSFCKNGIWYTKSHKDEQVNHLLRIGTTNYNDITIYEIIFWKFMVQWSMR